MNRNNTIKLVFTGVMIALVFVVTRLTAIPVFGGFFNLGDAAIMIAAIFLGRYCGFAAGGIGSALADISLGYTAYAPFTFIVKGLEGFVIGAIASYSGKKLPGEVQKLLAVVIGAAIMVTGYFLTDFYLIGLLGESFGYAIAVKNLPVNLVQAGATSTVGYILSTMLAKANAGRFVTR